MFEADGQRRAASSEFEVSSPMRNAIRRLCGGVIGMALSSGIVAFLPSA
jgi:hypothetical protein